MYSTISIARNTAGEKSGEYAGERGSPQRIPKNIYGYPDISTRASECLFPNTIPKLQVTVTGEITDETVSASVNTVAQMVFPFRALETQKQWMRRRMRKPNKLSIRKTVAAVGRLNNSLPLFSDGKESDKFSPPEILEIVE
jgi:hypothetical protein